MICNYNSRILFFYLYSRIYIYIYICIVLYKDIQLFLAHLDLKESPPGCQQVAVARLQAWMGNRTCKRRPNALLHRSCSCNPHLGSLALSGAFSNRTEAHWAHFLQVPLEVLHLHPEPVVLDGKV